MKTEIGLAAFAVYTFTLHYDIHCDLWMLYSQLVALGGFILFFGFLSFNGGSQASISEAGDGVVVANAIVNTVICGSAAALMSLVLEKLVYRTKKWSLLVTINGGLTGMVCVMFFIFIGIRGGGGAALTPLSNTR